MPRLTNLDGDQVAACPECDNAGEVFARDHEYMTYDDRCRCHKCGATFDEPNLRSSKNTGGAPEDPDGLPANLNPSAKRIIRANRGD